MSVPDPLNGVMFFAGSVFFTAAAGLQFHQAARVGPPSPDGGVGREKADLFAWRPGDIGWFYCFTQFLGTVLFNLVLLISLVLGVLGSHGPPRHLWRAMAAVGSCQQRYAAPVLSKVDRRLSPWAGPDTRACVTHDKDRTRRR
jgi:hypothetical protein